MLEHPDYYIDEDETMRDQPEELEEEIEPSEDEILDAGDKQFLRDF
jgi:hypothetical protein